MLFISIKLTFIIRRFTIITIYQFKRNSIITYFTCIGRKGIVFKFLKK